MKDMHISDSGLSHLKKLEAFKTKMYNDGAIKTKGHCTIGYGHLIHYSPCNSKKFASEKQYINGLTIKQATVVLRKDVKVAEKSINKLVSVTLTQNQFDALVSFVFNIGGGNFSSSTVLRVINKKQFNKVPVSMRMWKKTLGKVSNGLINRREAEIKLFRK